MDSIAKQIQALEKQKLELLKLEKQESLNNLLDSAKKYEGKVFIHSSKISRGHSDSITYFKKFYIGKGGYSNDSEYEVRYDSENINIQYDLRYAVSLNYTRPKETIYEYNNLYNIFSLPELTLAKFKELVKLTKGMTKNLNFTASENVKLQPSYMLDDRSDLEKIHLTKDLLDIPYIELTQTECNGVGKSIFLNGDIYFLSEKSIQYAISILDNKIKENDFDTNLLAEYNYRNRNNNNPEYEILITKFNKLNELRIKNSKR